MESACFVTGGTGFVGLNFVEEVLKRNLFSRMICLVRKDSRRLKYLRRIIEKNDSETETDTEILFGDITDKESLEKVFPEEVDCVYHIAADILLETPDINGQDRTNIDGTRNMVDVTLEKAPKTRFIYISSRSVYGKGNWAETGEIYAIDETIEKQGMNEMNYSKSKYEGELLVHKAIKEHDLDCVILQPCSMMGEYDFLVSSWNKLPFKIKNDDLTGLPGGHTCIADVKAFADVMCNTYELGKTGEEYIVGGCNCTFQQVGEIVSKYYEKKPLSVLNFHLFWLIGLSIEIIYGIRNVVCMCWKKPKHPVVSRAMITNLYNKYTVDTSKAVRELGLKVTGLEELVTRSCKFLDSLEEEKKREKEEGGHQEKES